MLLIKVMMVSNLATVPYLENCQVQNLRVIRHAQIRKEPREITNLVSSLCLLVLDFAKVDRHLLMQSEHTAIDCRDRPDDGFPFPPRGKVQYRVSV